MNTNTKNQHRTRKAAIAILAGLAVTGIIGASAASLGGIRSESLGAEVDIVGSCDDTGVEVAYDAAYDRATGAVALNTATISSVSNTCDGLDFEVTLMDGTGAVLGQDSGVVPSDLAMFEFAATFTGVDAQAVEGIAIAIFNKS